MEEQFKDIERLVKEAGAEQPPVDFLQNVMEEINVTSIDKSIEYNPLISKNTRIALSLLVIGLVAYLPFLSNGTSIMDKFDFSFLNLNDIKNPFIGFKIGNTTMYGIVFLAILFVVQITIIKKRIDKIYSV